MRTPLPVYVINLERDAERLSDTREAFARFPWLDLRRSPGIVMSGVPDTACRYLARIWDDSLEKNTLGCFLAHVGAWETVAGGTEDWALVVEDDVTPTSVVEGIPELVLPEDAELVFVNKRMADPSGKSGALQFLSVASILPHKAGLPSTRAAPGGDGYLLSKQGAAKLLKAVTRDGFNGHVDWRLLRYSLKQADVAAAGSGTWMTEKRALRPDSDKPQWEVLKAYRASRFLICARSGITSVRSPDRIKRDARAAAAAGQGGGKADALVQ